jgi:toxin ParE1/3/4
MTFEFHPEARAEFREAAVWYETQRPGLGERFQRSVRRSMDAIVTDPLRFRPVGDGLHVCRVAGFPYKVFYTLEAQQELVRIYAVMHDKRRPDYWRERVAK